MSKELTLFDLPSQEPCLGWSGNTLKTRLALNYKKIPYKTEWIPYVRLQEELKSRGIPANPPGSFADWTVPTVRCPDGTYIMDSNAIASRLEEMQPRPSLHLDLNLAPEAQMALGPAFVPIALYFGPLEYKNLLVPEDQEWFREDRSKRFGADKFDPERLRTGRQAAIDAAQPGLDAIVEVLNKYKRDEGPFMLGSEPNYGDFVIVAALHMFKRLSDDCFESFVSGREQLRALYEACQPWLERGN